MKPGKPELKRIEATLDQLNLLPDTGATSNTEGAVPSEPGKPKATDRPPAQAVQSFPLPQPKKTVTTVQPFPVQEDSPSTPLPKFKTPSFSSHRHAVNPNLAVTLLHQIEAIVVQWQLELEQVALQIHALYLEGPIVDGWLESQPYDAYQPIQSTGSSKLRHAEIEHLMEYVEAICNTPHPPFTDNQPRTGYRLCGLDADGQLWSRACPPQQVPYVSLAIARYQKLRILLGKKQSLETRLNQLIQNLTMVQGRMQEE
ncbi:MAG TPA: hypothetical protein V6D10_15240 [Trichocoleus sp.]|jgi:hypothetical protein